MYFYINGVNLPLLIIIFTCLKSVSLENNHLINILKFKDNLFFAINENVHKIMNKLFSALKLKSEFLKSSKVHLLMTMHSDLNNIAVKNFDAYKELINVTRVDNFTIVNDDVWNLTNTIDTVIKECQNEKKVKNHTEDTTRSNITMASSSVESLDFLEELLNKINSLTVDNFTVEQSNATFDEEADIFSLLKGNSADLKIWSPPTYAEKEELFSNLTRRIYKGKGTGVKKYPFMASIHLMNEFMCAGSIISRDFVITAASCLQIVYNNKKLLENPKSVFIRIGSDYTKRFGETIQIKDLYFHPEYEPFSLKNNLLLLKMAKMLKFIKKKKIRRIQYDKLPQKLSNVEQVAILGWGTDPTLDVKTYQPLAVSNIDVYDFDKCQEIYSNNYVTEKNFCVGFVSKGGGACKGDVGGPGIANGVLIGIISFGPPVCGAVDMPTVLVKLGYYANWIESVLHQQLTLVRPPNFRISTPMKPYLPTVSTRIIYESDIQNPNYAHTRMAKDYPEEIVILNQIFNEVILSNKTLIDDLLYGALEDDFSEMFKPSTKLGLHQHPLVNKSLFLLPEVHDFGIQEQPHVPEPLTTSSTHRTTTHPGLNGAYLDDYKERINYMEAVHKYTTPRQPKVSRTPPITKEPRHITDRYGRAEKITPANLGDESEYFKVVSSEDSEKISDNYESNKEDDGSKGISIEVTNLDEEYLISEETTEPSTRRSKKEVAMVPSEEYIEYKSKKFKRKPTRKRAIKNSKFNSYRHIHKHVRSLNKNKHKRKHKKIKYYYY